MTECKICGNGSARLEEHHVRYEPEETIMICASCHNKIHHDEDFRPDLTPANGAPDGFHHKPDGTTIQVTEDTRRRLKIEKAQRAAYSYSDTIEGLLDDVGNPGVENL